MTTQRSKLKRPDSRELKALEKPLIPYSPQGAGDFRFHLVYPNHYWVAMSNLGFQAVFDILARDSRVAVERGFLPDDSEDRSSRAHQWRTFETSRLLSDCDVLGFSLSFETDYPHLVRMLKNQGLLFKNAEERGTSAEAARFSQPIIIAGGTAVTLNPEPIADLVDVIVLGEAEELLPEFVSAFAEARAQGEGREELLLRLAQIEGVYVPAFYSPKYLPTGEIDLITVRDGIPKRPLRRFVKDLSKFGTFTRILTPETEFKSMFLTETGRGCEMGCRFCVAGYIYRPIRKRSEESIRKTLELGLANSDAIGFVGAAVSSHKAIAKLTKTVADAGARASLSSLMSQKVSRELAASITESEYKTVALAPEAGSERLRRAAGKRVKNDQVIAAATELAAAGVRGFKLYFIVGLPTEQDEDVDAIGDLAEKIRDAVVEMTKPTGKVGWVSLSINPFIPKASTPFQWEPMLDPKVLDAKIERVHQRIKGVSNLEMRFEPPKESYFQGLLSRGDRRVAALLREVEEQGENWKWLMKRTHLPILEKVPPVDFYVARRIPFAETLPWEIVDARIDRKLLLREAMRAHLGEEWNELDEAPFVPVEMVA